MDSFIRELYYGNINPNARKFDRNSPYAKAMDTVAKNEEILSGLLTGKEKEMFTEFCKAFDDIIGITACETYVDGFRTGAIFMHDTFISKENEFKSLLE